jgi:23S rRNA pseudouridine1911/1915/1917 synthase
MLRIEEPIGRDPRNRLRMAVVGPADPGKPATTTIELLDTVDEACLVKAILHTGRTHQIRVHMAHIGHPLVGDGLYGGSMESGLGRQALHAFRLAFTHPITGEALDFASPLPADLVHGLSSWGLRYNPAPAMAPAAMPAGPAAQPAGARPRR